tara:strand:- start:3590 stop:3772 length:183 start_codon:yes stop_codon:yes gene_type:complete
MKLKNTKKNIKKKNSIRKKSKNTIKKSKNARKSNINKKTKASFKDIVYKLNLSYDDSIFK